MSLKQDETYLNPYNTVEIIGDHSLSLIFIFVLGQYMIISTYHGLISLPVLGKYNHV